MIKTLLLVALLGTATAADTLSLRHVAPGGDPDAAIARAIATETVDDLPEGS